MTEYKVYAFGQITKFEAGVIYRAMKENKINVLKETTTTLYDDAKAYPAYAAERYSKDHSYYDSIYNAVKNILAGDYEKAQQILADWEQEQIKMAGKRSLFYKYQ